MKEFCSVTNIPLIVVDPASSPVSVTNYFDGQASTVLTQPFVYNNAALCPITEYSCELENAASGVTYDCVYDDFDGTVATFDTALGQFTFASD